MFDALKVVVQLEPGPILIKRANGVWAKDARGQVSFTVTPGPDPWTQVPMVQNTYFVGGSVRGSALVCHVCVCTQWHIATGVAVFNANLNDVHGDPRSLAIFREIPVFNRASGGGVDVGMATE
jgi:hypothetical protein